jgi:hypothetical protein
MERETRPGAGDMIRRLRKHRFWVYVCAFLLMAIPPIPLFLATGAGAGGWIPVLLALVIAGNLLALLVD